MAYSIKILSDNEFESLPYKRSGTALGVADPSINTAYVRQVAHPELQKYLIDHEFEHLIEEVPTDEEDGVRYKDFGGSMKKIGSFALPIAGALTGNPLLATAGGAAGGALAGGWKGGLLGGAGGFLGNKLLGGKGIGNIFSAFKPGGGSAGNLGATKFAGQLPLGASVGSGFNTGYGRAVSGSAGGSGFGSGLLNMFKNPATLLGAGSLAAGLLKSNPKVPPLPDSVNQLRSQVQSGGSPLGQQAQGVISGNLSKQFNPLSSEELMASTDELDRSQQQDVRRLEGLYASARPGTDYTTDTNYQRDLGDIQRRYSEERANVVGDRTRTAEQYFNQNQASNIQQALGASSEQMTQLAQLAQLDVEQIMTKLQMDYASALNFKQVFQNLGGTLLLQGVTGSTPFFGFNSGS